jgi:predicted nucleic acid-binding protein
MTRVVLDTNAYRAIGAGNAEALALLDRATAIAMNTIVLGELLAGFAAGSREEENRRVLAEFVDASNVEWLPLTPATAEEYARIYMSLRSAGRLIPTNDMWVAVSAMEHSMALFTYDRHFDAITRLRAGSTFDVLGI